MKCESLNLVIDDYVDELLTDTARRDLEEHAATCTSCASELTKAVALRESLRDLNSPVPAEGLFEDLAAAAAVKIDRNVSRRKIAYSLAAGVLLTICVSLFWEQQNSTPHFLDAIELSIAQPKNVHLLIDAAHSMDNVAVSLSLPKNVEIAGFPGKSHLSWFTDLHAGKNRLSIPLLAKQALQTSETVIAVISHENKSREYKIQVLTTANGNAVIHIKENSPSMATTLLSRVGQA